MAFQNIDSQQLGKFLQIAFSAGIRNQVSEEYRIWEQIARPRMATPDGREFRFHIQKSLGPSAIQYRNPTSVSYPTAQQVSTQECTAIYKEIAGTIELEYNLWNRAKKSPSKYAEPLAIEIESKTTAYRRLMSADLFGDGTGVVGTVDSAADAASQTVVTLSTANTARGSVGQFQYDDLLVAHQADGTARAPTVTGGTFAAYKIVDKDRDANTVTLQPVDASGAALTLTLSNLASTDVFYRVGQEVIPDLTSISDYSTCSTVIVGLESLSADDGRVVHGITMSGATKGSVHDGAAAALDWTMLQKALSKGKLAVGQGKYKYNLMTMSPEAENALISSREDDRRFITVEDNKRGTKAFGFVHGNDTLLADTNEFIAKNRIFCLPIERSGDKKVLEFRGTDFEQVDPNGNGALMMKPASAGGFERRVSIQMEGLANLIGFHPAAIVRVDNFTV